MFTELFPDSENLHPACHQERNYVRFPLPVLEYHVSEYILGIHFRVN